MPRNDVSPGSVSLPQQAACTSGPATAGPLFMAGLQPEEPSSARCVALAMTHKLHGEAPQTLLLLERLAAEGRAWMSAEAALARLELAELKLRALKAAGLAALALASVICVLVALTQAAIALLSQHVAGNATAALLVAVIFALVAALSAVLARRAMAWRADSMLLRWFGSDAEDAA